MPLATILADYINAAFSGLYVETHEPEEALRELRQLCQQHQNWSLAIWDIDRGLPSKASAGGRFSRDDR